MINPIRSFLRSQLFRPSRPSRPSCHFSYALLALLNVPILLAGGCLFDSHIECVDGFVLSGERCVPSMDADVVDAGDAGAGPDADAGAADADAGDRPDAGPCENACMGATPLCNTTTQTCVACLAAPDCMGALSECSAAGECVACTSNEHCEDPAASVCGADGACAPCNGPDACFGIVDGAATLDTCQMGTCIECTEGTAAEDCGANSCNPATGRCTDTPRNGLGVCEACVSDSECGLDHGCVPMTFEGADHGGFCLKTTSGGCPQPYAIALNGRTTLSDAPAANYCGINEMLTTCEAVRGLIQNTVCTDGGDECGAGALCRTVGVTVGLHCSYECSRSVQCDEPGNPGSTCGDGGTGGPMYCGG